MFLITLKDLEPGEEILYWMDDPYLLWTKTRAEKKSSFFIYNLYVIHSTSYQLGKINYTTANFHVISVETKKKNVVIFRPNANLIFARKNFNTSNTRAVKTWTYFVKQKF